MQDPRQSCVVECGSLAIADARAALQGTPDGIEAGVRVQLSNGAQATIKEVTDDEVVLDANHMLAGKALTFDVELMDIEKGASA